MPKKPSAARKLCKVCKIWIADNRIQWQQHEQAKKHRDAVKALLKEIGDKNEKREKEDVLGGSNVRRTVVNDRASRAAAQLLESAIGTSVKETISTPKVNPTSVQDIAVSNSAFQGTGEALDADGYPLPASAVYGQWESVPESDEEDILGGDRDGHKEDGENQGLREDAARGEDAATGEEAEWNDSATVPAKKRTAEEEENEAEEETGKDVQVLFKKRSAPRNRRARKKVRK